MPNEAEEDLKLPPWIRQCQKTETTLSPPSKLFHLLGIFQYELFCPPIHLPPVHPSGQSPSRLHVCCHICHLFFETVGVYLCVVLPWCRTNRRSSDRVWQAVRNLDDLECLACPPKYRALNTFYKYYTGLATAPYPTLFSACKLNAPAKTLQP
jgi:hypothetical protein